MFSSSITTQSSSLWNAPVAPYPEMTQMWPETMIGQRDQPVRAFLVDDDPHIRRVIAQDLMNDPRTLLVGQAGSLREARKSILSYAFDVLLLDLNLGDGDGLELLEIIKSKMPKALSIIVSTTERDDRIFQAFSHGAQGFLLKDSWFGNYSQAVLQVVNGGASITPSVAKKLLSKINEKYPSNTSITDASSSENLSQREIEIIKLIACGYSNPEISISLKISIGTVSTHIKNIYQKLQVHSKAHAVRTASMRGIF